MAGLHYKRKGWHIENGFYIIPIALVLLTLGTFYWQCGMLNLIWQRLIPYTISALAGTLMVFAISKSLLRKDSLIKQSMVYIGDHTMEILTWHFLSFKIVSLLIIWIYNLPVEQLGEFPVIDLYAYQGYWIAYLVLGVLFPLVLLKSFGVLFKKSCF